MSDRPPEAGSERLPDAESIYRSLLEQVRAGLEAESRRPSIIGVHSGGAWIAERLQRDLGLATPLGFLSSAFHRDDYGARGLPENIKPTQIGFEVAGADILLVDDILFTGRTVRAALNEIFDYGRPARVELAVLLDRGHRELPVAARYVGLDRPLAPPAAYVLSMDTHGRLRLEVE
ncbi:MAG: bifunctional pyr operon transcriptional regulator/uracil phosphoribosyltransferase PyrR [Burkholderiales bacterium]|nr:MAG: bifunctional pyr operon transcriptional regulator/uracil phosphoribosyltransferase PyrR [Burkholderiales bacterium]